MHHPDAIAPREGVFTFPLLSCPGLTGASSIPETCDVNTAASGILDRPVKPGDDIEWMFDSVPVNFWDRS